MQDPLAPKFRRYVPNQAALDSITPGQRIPVLFGERSLPDWVVYTGRQESDVLGVYHLVIRVSTGFLGEDGNPTWEHALKQDDLTFERGMLHYAGNYSAANLTPGASPITVIERCNALFHNGPREN